MFLSTWMEGFYFQFPKDSTSELALDHTLRECAVVATSEKIFRCLAASTFLRLWMV